MDVSSLYEPAVASTNVLSDISHLMCMLSHSNETHAPIANQRYTKSTSFAFTFTVTCIGFRTEDPMMRMLPHSNETRAPIANPLNSAQLEGTPYHFPQVTSG